MIIIIQTDYKEEKCSINAIFKGKKKLKEAFDLSIIELIPGFSFLTMWTLEEEDMNQLCNKNLEIQLVKKEFLGSSVKDTIFVNEGIEENV